MQKISILLFVSSLILITGCQTFNNSHIVESRQKLKDSGMAYCMRYNTSDKDSKIYKDYANAEGAYIQSGSHDLRIYKEFRTFIEKNYKKSSFKNFEGDNTLFSCLTLYNSPAYETYIEQLDSSIYEDPL